MIKRKTYSRHKLDFVSEELIEALRHRKFYEFNDLFLAVHSKLRARNAAGGGEEMLRLRVYEKLQSFVSQGLVEKTGKKYRGVPAALKARAEKVAASKAEAAANVRFKTHSILSVE